MAVEPDDTCVRDGVDIRLVARRQRWMLWLVLGAVLGYSLQYGLVPLLIEFGAGELLLQLISAIKLGLRIAVIAGTILLLRAMRNHAVSLLFVALFMFFLPLCDFVILLYANGSASRMLRRAGLRVGLMGVSDEEVVKRLAPNLCRRCAYDLTGNVSGICPECGTRIPQVMPMVVPKV